MNDILEQGRADAVRQALGLEYLTIGWNVVEGIVAIFAAVAAGSVALLGFSLSRGRETPVDSLAQHCWGLAYLRFERPQHGSRGA